MGLKSQFYTDVLLETKGVVIDYGKDRIRIARAGGSNKRYEKLLERKTRHIRRALGVPGAVSNDESNAIMREVFAETVVLGWEVNKGTETVPKWEKGIDPVDAGEAVGKLLPVTVENIVKVFLYIPDLLIDLQQQALLGKLFNQEIDEASAGN